MPPETITLSEIQREEVWEGWLHSEINSHYFGELASRFQKRQRWLTWATLVSSSGAAAALLTDWLPRDLAWIRPVLALLTAGISLYLVVEQFAQRAIDCSDLSFRWNRLATDFRVLWDDMYAEDARERLRALDDKAAELSRSGLTTPYNERLMSSCQDYVEKQHRLHSVA